jgi:predicted outer membrane protein
LGGLAIAQKNDDATNLNGKPNADDARFAKKAAMGGMLEVELGKITVQKADQPQVTPVIQR